jgi:hypothetical protein
MGNRIRCRILGRQKFLWRTMGVKCVFNSPSWTYTTGAVFWWFVPNSSFFVDHCLSLFFGHGVVCPSVIYGFGWHLCYFQIFLSTYFYLKIFRHTHGSPQEFLTTQYSTPDSIPHPTTDTIWLTCKIKFSESVYIV